MSEGEGLIVATRNRLIHGYLGIDEDAAWSTIRDDVPAIIPVREAIQLQYAR